MDIIFITGHRKSGTSVFHKLFEGHPDLVSFPVDLTIFYTYFPQVLHRLDGAVAQRARIRAVLGRAMAGLEGARPVGAGRDFTFAAFQQALDTRLDDDALASRPVLLHHMLAAFAETCALPLDRTWVVKETSQAIFAPKFWAGADDIRFLALLRDPRDNYAALRAGVATYYSALGEGEMQTLASLLNRARMDLIAARILSQTDPARFMGIRFEDLCAETEATMRKIAGFVGIQFHASLLSPTFLGEGYAGNSHDGVVFSGLSAEHVGRWPDRISAEEAMVIEHWLQDVMPGFGYRLLHEPIAAQSAFADFYAWYNDNYFYNDPYRTPPPG